MFPQLIFDEQLSNFQSKTLETRRLYLDLTDFKRRACMRADEEHLIQQVCCVKVPGDIVSSCTETLGSERCRDPLKGGGWRA